MATKRKRSGSDSDGGSGGEGSKRAPVENGLGRSERVVILDAGAQYGKVIDRRVRELFVESVILPLHTSASDIQKEGFRAIIISGGPNSVNDPDAPHYDPAIFSLATPILGICYGMQLINKHHGGTVERKTVREDGQFSISVSPEGVLFRGLDETQVVLLTHGDSIGSLAECLDVTARSGELIAAVQHKTQKVYGVQFHPEVELSENGIEMLKTFLYEVAGCHGNYTIANREESCIEYIRKTVGKSNVLSLVSGGVDSAVCTALLNRALGPERVIAVHIDNGFMRKNESSNVQQSLEELGLKVHVVQASHKFYTAQTVVRYPPLEAGGEPQQRATLPLHSITSPEEKRCVIGDTFMTVADNVISDLRLEADDIFLAQGTLRPDLIESASVLASSHAHVIKTHHNDTQLVRELREKGRVIEPLREFHKDEVRVLGETLGLPKELVHRHPFPGPGLAIRVICQTEAYIREDFHSTNILLGVIAEFGRAPQTTPPGVLEGVVQLLSQREREFLSQLTARTALAATLLPIYSVGVQGDARSYNYVAALSSDDDVDWAELMELAKIIPRLCHNVNRVVWVFGSVVKGPIDEVTPTYLRPEALATLRQADYLANSVLSKHEALGCVSQMPVVLLPLHFDRAPEAHPAPPSCQRSLVVRTFITSDFMTGIPATPGKQLPLKVLQDLVATLESVPGISRVLYDLTPKPPGTTEWE